MKRVRNYRVLRPVAKSLAVLCLLLWSAPPAAAFRPSPYEEWAKKQKTHRKPHEDSPATRRYRSAMEPSFREEQRAKRQQDGKKLSDADLALVTGRGAYRNPSFSGVLPWQRSLRDVNLCNGNLFKSFTDIQVAPARGAGLAWQRTYNSNDERVGPFGVGWTHAYDLRIQEADPAEIKNDGGTVGLNEVERTDFFGGKHHFHRDADGLYTPPPYLFNELESGYDDFLVNGPPDVLEDLEVETDGTRKHFTKDGNERICDWIEDRHGNRTELTYGYSAVIGGVTKHLLTEVEDPSGRSLEITWSDVDATSGTAYRITQVRGPYDSTAMAYLYTVTYEYNSAFNLAKVNQDPSGLDRETTYGYTTFTGASGSETGLLSSITDALSHTVSYTYSYTFAGGGLTWDSPTGTLWVSEVSEPGTGGALTWTITPWSDYGVPVAVYAESSGGLALHMGSDAYLRKTYLNLDAGDERGATYRTEYDESNNVTACTVTPYRDLSGGGLIPLQRWQHFTYGPHGNVLTSYVDGNSGVTTTTYYHASKYFQKESVEDPLGHLTVFDYFEKGDTSPGNRGELKWVRDARYGTTGEQFDYTYNSYGQKVSETNLNNVVTEFTYGDTYGNLTQVVQDPGTGHLNRTTSMQYDAAGRVTQSTDPKSQSTNFEYNGVGQPTEVSNSADTVEYTYGANGRTATVTDHRGTTSFTYQSGNNRLASVQDPVTGTISYAYGADGQRTSMTLPSSGGTWTYTYADWTNDAFPQILAKDDPNAVTWRLKGVEDDQGRPVEYDLDSCGGIQSVICNQGF